MLGHYQQIKNLLVSYSPKALGFLGRNDWPRRAGRLRWKRTLLVTLVNAPGTFRIPADRMSTGTPPRAWPSAVAVTDPHARTITAACHLCAAPDKPGKRCDQRAAYETRLAMPRRSLSPPARLVNAP